MNWLRKFIFNLWYLKDPPWDTNISPPELIDFIERHPPGRAVDLGCGTGTNVITLARHQWQATGIDYIRKAIRTARRKAVQANVQAEFRLGDVTGLGWVSQPFDLALDIGCFHSLTPSSREMYLKNLDSILAPGGYFLLYTFLKESDSSSVGITEIELDRIASRLRLIDKKEGMDGPWISGWFTFQRSTPPQEKR